MVDNNKLLIVRFVRDYGIYAAQDQASFAEQAAANLVQIGVARIVGEVDAQPAQVPAKHPELQLQPVVSESRRK